MTTSDDAPNLLDAVLAADGEGIQELLGEVARRIGAKSHEIEIVFSARKHGKNPRPLIGILRNSGASYHADSTTAVIELQGGGAL